MISTLSQFHSKCRTIPIVFSQFRMFSNIQNESGKTLIKDTKNFKVEAEIKESRLPKRNPLVKNFFIGQVDKELMSHPEVIGREEMSTLYREIDPIKHLFDNSIHYSKEEFYKNLKEFGVFGFNVPKLHKGKEYSWSENLIASQYENQKTDIALLLSSHRSVCDVIELFGSKEQKQKYLSHLASGKLIAADGVLEWKNSTNQFFNTKAEFNFDSKKWNVSGEKSFLHADSNVDLLLVLAETRKLDAAGEMATGITLFAIDTSLPGVKINTRNNSYGIASINLENVQLSNDDIIGQENEGFEPAKILFQNSRLRSSYVSLGLMKNLINKITKFVIETKSCGVPLQDMESITSSLSSLTCRIYGLESMLYFTTGLIDEFENQDVEMESAIIKLYTQESLWNLAQTLMSFMGRSFFDFEINGEINLHHIIRLLNQGETIDSLKLFIALSGLKHAGMSLNDEIKKLRNPLFNPTHMIYKYFQSTNVESPKTKMFLGQELHPSLEPAAQHLEHSIYRLQLSTELLLTRYGNEIIGKHTEIKRLTDMVTSIYATFASLSRSSRSYCIGLNLADYEMLIATTLSLTTGNFVKELALNVVGGPFNTNDVNYQKISKKLIEQKGYFSENPIKFNY